MKKALIMTSIAFVLLLAVVAAGLNVIFTVSYIEASFSTFSEQGDAEAQSLKGELDKFVGKSMTFLKLGEVEKTVEKYPSFRVESVKKKFPKTVEISIQERRELFAYQTEDGHYAIIDSEGMCVRLSDDNVSRTGGENVLLKNFTLPYAVGQKVDEAYFDALLDAFAGFESYIADVRANVREVTLNIAGSASNPLTHLFEIEMQEGVMIEMNNPLSRADEKAKAAMEMYNELGDIEKMYDCIVVSESLSGEIQVQYLPRR